MWWKLVGNEKVIMHVRSYYTDTSYSHAADDYWAILLYYDTQMGYTVYFVT